MVDAQEGRGGARSEAHVGLSTPGHTTYPYLLRDLRIERPNQVWCTDITYVRLVSGFVYLTVIMDWHSRYVLSWELSVSMETRFCLTALERALSIATPEIFNSDQGSQFTSAEFTERLLHAGVLISRDGRGRVFDNIFVERLWRSVKYEEVYLKSYETVREAKESLGSYFRFYNTERLHEALGYRTPLEVYLGKERLTPTPPQPRYVHLNQPHYEGTPLHMDMRSVLDKLLFRS